VRFLITGGAGYVGFSLVRQLAQRSDVEHIRVVDNLARKNHALFVSGAHGDVPIDFRRVDILDGPSLRKAAENVDVVFHLAAHATTPQSDLDHHIFDQINNWGSGQVALAVEQSSAHTVVYLSSFAVYGSDAQAVDEATPPVPTSSYGIAKLAGEEQLQRLEELGRTVHIVRAGNVFGFNPAIRFDAVINAMCFDAWTERKIRIHGDGHQTRPFVEVSTLASALADLARSDAPSGVWNLATHNASIGAIADIVRDLVPDTETMHLHRDQRMQEVQMVLPCSMTEYVPLAQSSLYDALAKLIAALRGR